MLCCGRAEKKNKDKTVKGVVEDEYRPAEDEEKKSAEKGFNSEKSKDSADNKVQNKTNEDIQEKKSDVSTDNSRVTLVKQFSISDNHTVSIKTPDISPVQPKSPSVASKDIKTEPSISPNKQTDHLVIQPFSSPRLVPVATPPIFSKSTSTAERLPRWLSEETDDGTEPPVRPVGKDEIELRRQKFFEELMLSRDQDEHHVRFNPRGPQVLRRQGCSIETDPAMSAELNALVDRLEAVTTRLEDVATSKSQSSNGMEVLTPAVQAFVDIMQGPLVTYLKLSKQIGGDVAKHADLIDPLFQTQKQFLILASQSRQPSPNELQQLLRPTSEKILAVQEFREKNRGSNLFNHLSAISESAPALGWVAVSPTPAPYIKEMNDAGQFYTNRVLKDWKEKDKTHVEWVKAWIQTLTELQTFVKQHHTTGLVWNPKGSDALKSGGVSAGAPPPPPGPPPPPPMDDFPAGDLGPAEDRSALFAEINRGQDVTKALRKVTSEMQTHKNPSLRTGPAPFKPAAVQAHTPAGKPAPALTKPPTFAQEGKKWVVEYQKDNHSMVIENAPMNNVVYMYRCENSTVQVKGKINSIVMDSCKKSSVVFDTLVSSVEFVNCQSVQMQVLGSVATISVDKTDGCQMYLSKDSLAVEIVSSKSSEMNVMVPKNGGDFAEYPVPEQFKTTVSPKGLTTTVVESKG